jgi:hypothetical protein
MTVTIILPVNVCLQRIKSFLPFVITVNTRHDGSNVAYSSGYPAIVFGHDTKTDSSKQFRVAITP